MSAVAARPRAGSEPAPSRGLVDRLVYALPLTAVYVALCILYGWQAWAQRTPWLFTDELEFAQLSRSIAETGRPALRGEAQSFQTLYTVVTAPAWWLDDTESAYRVAKWIGVLVMTSALFPAYALGRLLVPRVPALLAATATVSIPAFLYSSFLVSETLAYPYATLALFLIVKALATRDPRWIAGAVVACLVAPAVRGQLVAIPALAALATLVVAWNGDRWRAWRSRWSVGDWGGAALLALGAAFVATEILSHADASWQEVTRYNKDRMLEYGIWATGAFTIGLGVLPVVGGLASLVRPRGERATPALRAFVAVFSAALVAFVLYAAVKAARLSLVFGERAVERNLIYLSPLFFVGTALVLTRRRVHVLGLAAGSLVAGVLIVLTPYFLDYPYSDAPGFAILSFGNRELGWSTAVEQWVLLALLAVSVLLVLAPALLRRWPPALRAALGLTAALVLAWNLTAGSYAASGSRNFADQLLANLPQPVDWIDRATGGEPATYLGQSADDRNGLWLTEFWNRSLDHVWSFVEGDNPPGPSVTPNLGAIDGRLDPDSPTRYVVAGPGVSLVGRVRAKQVERQGETRLYEIDRPLRVSEAVTGISADGWVRSETSFTQYVGRAGVVEVYVTRGICAENAQPGRVQITVGTLAVGKDKQPDIGRVSERDSSFIFPCNARTLPFKTPPPPFRIEVRIAPPFSPAVLDPRSTDRRQLAGKVSYSFRPNAAP